MIVPAYNEEERLPIMLAETVCYLQTRPKTNFEMIIVDDGSKDSTYEVAKSASDKYASLPNIKMKALQRRKNRGKGCALRNGIFCGQGKSLLMVDADAATEISDLQKLEDSLEKGNACVFGSRAHFQDEAIANRYGYKHYKIV